MPSLESYYTYLPYTVSDPSYRVQWMFSTLSTEDLNGDGNQDLVLLGATYPASMVSGGLSSPQTQGGRVLFGDGNGGFASVSETIFPVSTLQTVHPRKKMIETYGHL